MNYYIKHISYYLLYLILVSFICSLINIVGVNSTITNLILFIFNIMCFLILGYKNGNNASKKGYIAGLKIGLLLLLILFIINIIITHKILNITMLIYYLILILSSTFGGMLGISKKKED